MLDLQYLIIYQNDGTPIYSRCFGNLCKLAMRDDVLFAAFLSSVTTFASFNADMSDLELDGVPVQVEYPEGGDMINLVMEDLRLVFFYNQTENFTVAAGFNLDQYENSNARESARFFFNEVNQFVLGYEDTDWRFVDQATLIRFEQDLLQSIVHKFFEEHNTKSKCPFGDNCPIRLALYESKETSLVERIRAKVKEYRSMNMMKKMKRMMFGAPYTT